MNRRRALIVTSVATLAACGGSGDSGGADAGPVPEARVRSIAVWGDSLARDLAGPLALAASGREVFSGGVSGNTSSQVLARQIADTEHTGWVTVFWFGRNNIAEAQRVVADMRASAAHLSVGNDRFLVLSVLNSGNEPVGSAGYPQIRQLNESLAAAFPANYLDVRSFLVSQADPMVPGDLVDQPRDVPPRSLRADILHLNSKGNSLVAAKVMEVVLARGW